MDGDRIPRLRDIGLKKKKIQFRNINRGIENYGCVCKSIYEIKFEIYMCILKYWINIKYYVYK